MKTLNARQYDECMNLFRFVKEKHESLTSHHSNFVDFEELNYLLSKELELMNKCENTRLSTIIIVHHEKFKNYNQLLNAFNYTISLEE